MITAEKAHSIAEYNLYDPQATISKICKDIGKCIDEGKFNYVYYYGPKFPKESRDKVKEFFYGLGYLIHDYDEYLAIGW